jgi:proteasome lid subunit RPN8/RPN11
MLRIWWDKLFGPKTANHAEALLPTVEAVGEVTPVPAPVEAPPVSAEPVIAIRAGVLATMFKDFHSHRATDRGNEETGWLLLGRRDGRGATIEAALPPGEFRDAGMAHVNMNSTAQSVAMRLLKRAHSHLDVLGVAHTHPGRMCRPSQGDYQGDSQWVPYLVQKEGIFAIGVWGMEKNNLNSLPDKANMEQDDDAEVRGDANRLNTIHEDGRAQFHWYALAAGDQWYRHQALQTVEGDDLAATILGHWPVIEQYAGSIDRLIRMQGHLELNLLPFGNGDAPALLMRQPLPRPGEELQVVLQGREVVFFRMVQGEPEEIEAPAERLDSAFYEVMSRLTRGSRKEQQVWS